MPDALGRLRRVADSWRGDAILALVLVMILLSRDAATGVLSDARGVPGVACSGVALTRGWPRQRRLSCLA